MESGSALLSHAVDRKATRIATLKMRKSVSVWRIRLGFIIVLSAISASWLAIPLRYPDTVTQWFSNEGLPACGLWIVGFGLWALWIRRRFIDQRGHGADVCTIAGIIMIASVWFDRPSAFWAHIYCLLAAGLLFRGIGGGGWLRAVLPSLAMLAYLPTLPQNAYDWIVHQLEGFGACVSLAFSKIFLSPDYSWQWVPAGAAIRSETANPLGVCITAECSGYQSLYGLTLLSLFFIADIGAPKAKKIICVVFAVLLALLSNLGRLILSLTLIHCGYGYLTQGLSHSATGQIIMFIEMLLLFLLWRWLGTGGCRLKVEHKESRL